MKKVDVVIFLVIGLVVLGVYSASTISDLKRKISNQEWIIDDYKDKISELEKLLEKYENNQEDDVAIINKSYKDIFELLTSVNFDLAYAIFDLKAKNFDSFNKKKNERIRNLNTVIKNLTLSDSEKQLLNLIKKHIESPNKNSADILSRNQNRFGIFYRNYVSKIKKMEEEAFYGK